ncbi:MAG: hypothetical protein WCA35_17495, partial [Kovacikia sp.]
LLDKAFSHQIGSKTSTDVSNSPGDSDASLFTSEPLQGVQYVQQAVFNIKASRKAFYEASQLAQSQHQHNRSEAAEQRQIARMQQFLDSGDRILMAEAMAWAQANPGVLQVDRAVG